MARVSACSTSGSSARSRRSSTRARSATRSMLVAAKVDPENPWRAANIINAHPGVSHNYLRNHEFNIWFTIATEPDSPLGLEGTLEVLARTRRRRVDPPAADAEAVQDPHGPRDGGRAPTRWPRRPRRAEPAETERQPYDEFDIAVIRATPGRHAGRSPSPTRPPPRELGHARRSSCSTHLRGDAGAPAAAPRRRDPVPPPRRLQRQRDGRLEGPRRADHGARPADGRVPRHLALLPAPDLRGLALLGLHDGPRPLEGGVRRDPRLDRRRHRDRRSARRSTPRPSSRRSGCSTSPTTTATGNASTPACERAGSADTHRRARRSCTSARCGLLPGGVNSPVRAMRSIGRDPIFIASRRRARRSPTSTATSTSTGCARGDR